MKTHRALVLSLSFVLPLMTACSSPEKQAAELLETARFEEKQSNREHAAQLYNELVRKYPRTEAGKTAAERLKQLQEKKP